MENSEKETTILEEGTLRRFRFSNNGFGYPTYPPIIRCDREGKEVCRYDSIVINGCSWTIMEESIATKGVAKGKMVPRIYIETRAEVVATLAIMPKKEDSFVDDIEPEDIEPLCVECGNPVYKEDLCSYHCKEEEKEVE